MQQSITLTFPGTGGVPVQRTVPNPLYSYIFTSTRKNTDFGTNAMRQSSQTRRQPPSDMSTSRNDVFNQIMRNTYTSRRQNTLNLFTATTNFNSFSNTAYRSDTTPAGFVSCEGLHNEVHVAAGGSFGHMSFVEYSSFDPFFFLHHCQIDRLVAMYQAIYRGRGVLPQTMSPTFARPFNSGTPDDNRTPLRPFRNANGNYFTSADLLYADSIWNLGYAYAEVPTRYQGNTAGLRDYTRGRVTALYSGQPPSGTPRKRDTKGVETAPARNEWVIFIKYNTKDFYGNMQLLVFLDNGPLPGDSPIDRKIKAVGSCSAFSSAAAMDMAKDATASIPLTDLLVERGSGLDRKSAVKYLKRNLRWIITKDDEIISSSTVPSLVVGVSSSETEYVDGLPQFGKWLHATEVTDKLPAGFTRKDAALAVGSIAPPVSVDDDEPQNSSVDPPKDEEDKTKGNGKKDEQED